MWESIQPRYEGFGIEVPALTVEQLWARVNTWGVEEIDLLKLDCEGAEYVVIPELSALGLMPRVGWIRGEWHSRKENALLAAFLGQAHAYNIDEKIPHDVGLGIGQRKGRLSLSLGKLIFWCPGRMGNSRFKSDFFDSCS